MSDITQYLDTLNKIEVLIEVTKYKPYKIYALIDTGAQTSIIHPNLYPEEYYKEIEKKYFSGLSAGVTCTHLIETMDIKIFDTKTATYKSFKVPYVYIIKGSKVDFILGMDFILENLPLIINKDTIKLGLIETIRIKNNFKFHDQEKLYQSIHINTNDWKTNYLTALEELFSDNPLKEFYRSPRYMTLTLKQNEKPFRMKPLVYNQQDLEEYKKQILEWENLGIVEKTESEYMSTSFVVRNHAEISRGKARIVINYKKLNNITEFDGYFIPSIESLIYKIEDNKYFSKFDAKSGFWQIKIKDNLSKKLTAFSTPYGHFQWNVMPFGLKNAPQIFQKWMNSLFCDLPFVLVYIDDILVMSKTLNEHIHHLDAVKVKFLKHGIILGKRKVVLAATEIDFLGRKIIGGKFELQDHIIKKIKNFPEITTLKQLQAFVGILNYGRKYFQNLSTLINPLIQKINEITKAYKETHDKPISRWDTDKIPLTLTDEHLATITLSPCFIRFPK